MATTLLAVLAPLAGDHAVTILAALAGSMWPLSRRPTTTRREAAVFLLRMASTAAALGGLCAWLLETHAGIPGRYAPPAAAWLIGFMGDDWRGLVSAAIDRLRGGAPSPSADAGDRP